MKINKIVSCKYKLLNLKLVKTKTYKKNQNNFIKLEDISSRLKKALHIIYKYHMNKKQILFVGSPINMNHNFKKYLKNTKHIIIPKSAWMNGSITNQESCFKYISKNHKIINNKISEILFQMKKKSDLIVILDSELNASALNEGYLAKIPVISLNSDLDISNFKSNYKIPGNFKFVGKKIRDTFFYSILIATLKKANKNSKNIKNVIKKEK